MKKTLKKLFCAALLLGSLELKSVPGKTVDEKIICDDLFDFPNPNDKPYYQKADLIQNSNQVCFELKGQLFKESFFHNNIERTFWTYIPSNYKPFESDPASLILIFHGHGGDGLGMMNYVEFKELAEAEGNTIIIAPDGTGTDGKFSWNAYHCCGYGLQNNSADVGFISQLIDYAKAKYNTGAKAAATGHSNGGMLCYKLASQLSDKIIAVADVSGCSGGKSEPGAPLSLPTKPEHVVPVMMVHGFKDDVIPFDGCKENCYREDFPFYEGEKLWRDFYNFNWLSMSKYDEEKQFRHNQYTSEEGAYRINGGSIVRKYPTVVESFLFTNSGHEWPLVENSTIFITKTIWDFFKRFSENREAPEIDRDNRNIENRVR